MAATIIGSASINFTGSWTSTSGGYSGENYFYHAAGTGTNKANWIFTGLTASSTYYIALTWFPFTNRATNTPWKIYDSNGTGGAVLASGTLNQQNAPCGPLAGGVYFTWCGGSVTPSGTALTIEITDNANQFVIADAAYLVPTTDPVWFGSVASGNWSSAATWGPSSAGPPSTNSTTTIGHAITVNANSATGLSGFTTGGTPAVQFISGGSLTVSNGFSLTLQGDMTHPAASTVTWGAGSSIIFKPPSGQQCVWNFTGTGSTVSTATANGTSGSHAVLETDTSLGGLATYMSVGNFANNGLISATYLDITNFGTSSNVGVVTSLKQATGATSITHCTFTSSSYQCTTGSSWDDNLTFQYNTFVTSAVLTLNGQSGACAAWSTSLAPTSGTRLVDSCTFDSVVANNIVYSITWSNNLFQRGSGANAAITFSASSTWPSASYFSNNVLRGGDNVGGLIATLFGSAQNCYWRNLGNSNPHYVQMSGSPAVTTMEGHIFEAEVNDGTGDCIHPPTVTTGTPTMSITNCIVLPGPGGRTSGKLNSNNQTGKVALTVEHNTFCSTAGESGLCQINETSASYLGEIASARANIIWSLSTSIFGYVVNGAGAGSMATDAVTVAGYNWLQNPNTGTITANGSSTSATGYNEIVVSTAGFPSSQLGTGDQTGDPQFVDYTRNLASWGGTPAGGGVATMAGAFAAITANPALIGQATTGLLAWIRAGFVPQNSALKNASYPSDPSTTDANGNAWPGGRPGIGAMAFAGITATLSVTTANDTMVAYETNKSQTKRKHRWFNGLSRHYH